MKQEKLKRMTFLLILAIFLESVCFPVYASELPSIDLGIFFNTATGPLDGGGGTDPGQNDPVPPRKYIVYPAPKDSDILTRDCTVVATSTKWQITPSFNIARVRTTDPKIVGITRKLDRSKSQGRNKWYCAQVSAKKPGIEMLILDGTKGEREIYFIFAENPKVNAKALKAGDITTISTDAWLSGTKYLKPDEILSAKPEVASIDQSGNISVSSNGTTRITLRYGKRKVTGTVRATLPAFTKKKVTIKNKPVKLKLKNLGKTATVSYASANPSIAKVNDQGYVAPVSNGETTVTAVIGKVKAECTVIVQGLK